MKKKNIAGKIGRPKKEDEIKDVFRTVRFTPEEDACLAEKVEQYGGTRSEFLRKAALSANIISFPDQETIKLFQDYKTIFQNIGTNLNAIAHRANIEEIEFDSLDLQECKEQCDSFKQMINEFRDKMMS